MGNNPLSYNPPAPLPGRYVATIMTTYCDDRGIYITYDIATGDHAGWATITYLTTGYHPLQQRIDIARGRQVLECLCHAAGAGSVNDLAGKQVVIDMRYDDRQSGNPNQHNYRICRTYPVTTTYIHPDDIRAGTERWSSGSADTIQAAMIAYRSGLPVLMVDKQERQSPMVDWCAEHNIAVFSIWRLGTALSLVLAQWVARLCTGMWLLIDGCTRIVFVDKSCQCEKIWEILNERSA